ncbi:MAG: PP2C family protein-serine/threonine phosphatase [Vampirovibrionales bacterium]
MMTTVYYQDKLVCVGTQAHLHETVERLAEKLPDHYVTLREELDLEDVQRLSSEQTAEALLENPTPEEESIWDLATKDPETLPTAVVCMMLPEDEQQAQMLLDQLSCLDPVAGPHKVVVLPKSPQVANSPMIQQALTYAADMVVASDTSEDMLALNLSMVLRRRQQDHFQKQELQTMQQLNQELYERSNAIERELTVARQLQHSLLPNAIIDAQEGHSGESTFRVATNYESKRLKITSVYVPCDALGGDLYDVVPLSTSEDHLAVSISDVSGHGLPAGFITAIYKAAFSRATNRYKTPEAILDAVNQDLAAVIKTEHYVTACTACINPHPDDETLIQAFLSSAGHPCAVWYRAASQSIERPGENGPPLVWLPEIPYDKQEIVLQKGDKLLMFTDGITEMWNQQDEFYGEPRLEETLSLLSKQNSMNIMEGILKDLSTFAEGRPLQDDLSMLLVEIV